MNNSPNPTGYLARPQAGTGTAVLVLHAWWGLTNIIKDVCDRLAALGFVAYAPDLYHGQLATSIAEAEQLSSQLDGEEAKAETAVSVTTLLQHANAQTIGIIGFSMGASFATHLAGEDPEHVRAVVLFYGAGEGDFDQMQATFMGHFAENDPYEPAEWVTWMENELKKAGKTAVFHHYPNVGHWFFEPDRPDAYNEAAAQLAWERTVAFLRQNLSLPVG